MKQGREVSFVPLFPHPTLGGTKTPHGDIWCQPGCSPAEGSSTTMAGQGGLACTPGWTGTLEDEFLGQVLFSSQNPLLGTEALLYKTWQSSGPISARAACLLSVKRGEFADNTYLPLGVL